MPAIADIQSFLASIGEGCRGVDQEDEVLVRNLKSAGKNSSKKVVLLGIFARIQSSGPVRILPRPILRPLQ